MEPGKAVGLGPGWGAGWWGTRGRSQGRATRLPLHLIPDLWMGLLLGIMQLPGAGRAVAGVRAVEGVEMTARARTVSNTQQSFSIASTALAIREVCCSRASTFLSSRARSLFLNSWYAQPLTTFWTSLTFTPVPHFLTGNILNTPGLQVCQTLLSHSDQPAQQPGPILYSSLPEPVHTQGPS